MATREVTDDEVALLEAFRKHQAHARDSLYGRCALCGMHWGAQARGQALLDELREAV